MAAKATGRMPMLTVEEQRRLLAAIDSQYRAFIEELDATGMNNLEARVLELDAKELESSELLPAAEKTDSPFGAATNLSLMDVKKVPRPPSWDTVQGFVKPMSEEEISGWVDDASKEYEALRTRTFEREKEYEALAEGGTDKQRKEAEKGIARQQRIRSEGALAAQFLERWLRELRPTEGGGTTINLEGKTLPGISVLEAD